MEWVAFRSGGKQEDIYVCRSNGKDLRKLTDDAFRDRGPGWTPDGRRIVFYSDRTGRYEFWSINADGSGLQQITKLSERSLWFPRYSPDGSRLMGYNDAGTIVFDLSQPAPLEKGTALPLPAPEIAFSATSWSPNGEKLAGLAVLLSDNSAAPGLLIYSFKSNKYTTFKNIIPDFRKSHSRCDALVER
jgi:Tol biopolymer transport system component